MIFPNLAVKDLDRAVAFFAELGFEFNPQFTDDNEPMDLGFMYARSFDDPDGHRWEIVWMDPAALEQGSEVEAGATAS